MSAKFRDASQPVAWTLDEGLYVVRRHQQSALVLGYNLSLGGGVLNKGWSAHDLDIVCAPAKHSPTAPFDFKAFQKFVEWLDAINSAFTRTMDTHGDIGKYWNDHMRLFSYVGQARKIDWFVVHPPGAHFPGSYQL